MHKAGRVQNLSCRKINKFFTDGAWADCICWLHTDKKVLAKINDLIKEIARILFLGIGNPELLKYFLSGYLVKADKLMSK